MCRDLCKVHKLKKDVTNSNEVLRAGRELKSHLSWSPVYQVYKKSSYQRSFTSLYHVFFGGPRFSSCFLDEGYELLLSAVNDSLAAAGDVVVVVGNRLRWKDVQMIFRRGDVQSWVPQSSTTCFVYCFSCLFSPFAAAGHIL